ncbi:MAG: hypothetical protein AAB316_08315 [Bacteroidota bacterium]
MKRVNFKSILMALAVTLAFLFAGTERGTAQGTQSGLYTPPTGTFLNSDQAQQQLFDQFMIDKENLAQYAQGSPLFTANYRRILYYVAIRQHLINGLTVPNAIAEGLKDIPIFIGNSSSSKQLQLLKDEAIAFLKS